MTVDVSPAEACSEPWGIYERTSLPEDGATAVPTNVEIRVKYEGEPCAFPGGPQLRPMGGDPTELTTVAGTGTSFDSVGIYRPMAELAPDTTYELLDRAVVPCDGFDDCTLPDFEVFATFTTGSGPDSKKPKK